MHTAKCQINGGEQISARHLAAVLKLVVIQLRCLCQCCLSFLHLPHRSYPSELLTADQRAADHGSDDRDNVVPLACLTCTTVLRLFSQRLCATVISSWIFYNPACFSRELLTFVEFFIMGELVFIRKYLVAYIKFKVICNILHSTVFRLLPHILKHLL